MRTHHLLGIAAIVLIGFGAKVAFFPVTPAKASVGAPFDVSRMHENKVLPEQQMNDMSFVYTDSK
jgi:hypothetical protein